MPAGSGSKERRDEKFEKFAAPASTRLGARISTIQVARDLKFMFNDAMTMGARSEDASLHV